MFLFNRKARKEKNRKGRREKTGIENVIENKTISLTIKVNWQINPSV
jgi:hypothetical protein